MLQEPSWIGAARWQLGKDRERKKVETKTKIGKKEIERMEIEMRTTTGKKEIERTKIGKTAQS